MADGPFYYCLKHHTVEGPDTECKAEDRLGPYATADEAAHALEHVEENNEKWDAQDEADKGEDDGWGPFKS